MKKIPAYALVAVLLGVVTMLAPFALFVGEIDTNKMDTQGEQFYSSPADYLQRIPSKTEQTQGITPVTHFTDAVFIVFLPVFSLAMALGVTFYFRRKSFSSSSQ